jgi:hypothetical protein
LPPILIYNHHPNEVHYIIFGALSTKKDAAYIRAFTVDMEHVGCPLNLSKDQDKYVFKTLGISTLEIEKNTNKVNKDKTFIFERMNDVSIENHPEMVKLDLTNLKERPPNQPAYRIKLNYVNAVETFKRPHPKAGQLLSETLYCDINVEL